MFPSLSKMQLESLIIVCLVYAIFAPSGLARNLDRPKRCSPKVKEEFLVVIGVGERNDVTVETPQKWVDCNLAKSCTQTIGDGKTTTSGWSFGAGVSARAGADLGLNAERFAEEAKKQPSEKQSPLKANLNAEVKASVSADYSSTVTTQVNYETTLELYAPSKARLVIKQPYEVITGLMKVTEEGCGDKKESYIEKSVMRPIDGKKNEKVISVQYERDASLTDENFYNLRNKKIDVSIWPEDNLEFARDIPSPAICSLKVRQKGADAGVWSEDMTCTIIHSFNSSGHSFSNKGQILGPWIFPLKVIKSTTSIQERNLWITNGDCDVIVGRLLDPDEENRVQLNHCQVLPVAKGKVATFRINTQLSNQKSIGMAVMRMHTKSKSTLR